MHLLEGIQGPEPLGAPFFGHFSLRGEKWPPPEARNTRSYKNLSYEKIYYERFGRENGSLTGKGK
jgi:hypothetical protein